MKKQLEEKYLVEAGRTVKFTSDELDLLHFIVQYAIDNQGSAQNAITPKIARDLERLNKKL
jgi:hypothetical protein